MFNKKNNNKLLILFGFLSCFYASQNKKLNQQRVSRNVFWAMKYVDKVIKGEQDYKRASQELMQLIDKRKYYDRLYTLDHRKQPSFTIRNSIVCPPYRKNKTLLHSFNLSNRCIRRVVKKNLEQSLQRIESVVKEKNELDGQLNERIVTSIQEHEEIVQKQEKNIQEQEKNIQEQNKTIQMLQKELEDQKKTHSNIYLLSSDFVYSINVFAVCLYRGVSFLMGSCWRLSLSTPKYPKDYSQSPKSVCVSCPDISAISNYNFPKRPVYNTHEKELSEKELSSINENIYKEICGSKKMDEANAQIIKEQEYILSESQKIIKKREDIIEEIKKYNQELNQSHLFLIQKISSWTNGFFCSIITLYHSHL